jgi:acyl carrier protein
MPDIRWLDWQTNTLNPEMLRTMLTEEHPEYLGITGIPNARLRTERAAIDVLRHNPDIGTVAELREQIEHYSGERGIEPEELWRLEHELPYQVELSWAQGRSDGAFDALFVRCDAGRPVRFSNPECQRPDRSETPSEPNWNVYANNPTQAETERKLIPQLRAYLQKRLPEYMIPSAFVLLDKLPLTPNGKIDRQALPAPERTRPELSTAYVAPRSELEETLVDVWKELLDLEQIGVLDDFFELGGDSLTATRLLAHIRSMFEIELPIAGLFEGRTIAGLAEIVETTLIAEIEALSEEDAQRLLAVETDKD